MGGVKSYSQIDSYGLNFDLIFVPTHRGFRCQDEGAQELNPDTSCETHLIRQDLQDYQDFFVLVGSATVPTIFSGTR